MKKANPVLMKVASGSISLLLMLLLTSFDGSKKANSTEDGPLNRLNWSEKNYTVLNQLIVDYGKGGPCYDAAKPPYALFDWDQTCAHFDVEEALLRYQLTNLRFKLTKGQFKALLKDSINGIDRLSADYGNISLADINSDLISDYNFLCDNYVGLNGKMPLPEIQKSPQYNDFLVKVPFLYNGYCATTGIGDEYGYPWVLYLLAGYTIDEVKGLARSAIHFELGNQLSKVTKQSPSDIQSKVGVVATSYTTGLRVFPEIQNLMATFRSHGIEVFVVSASYLPVVQVFSGIGNFGYQVPAENVIAMELAIGEDGKIVPEYQPGWVKTFRQGKVEAIDRVIKKGLGKGWDPLFAAGDSDGDYEMLTKFPGMKLSLIWNRVKGGEIGQLCRQAVAEAGSKAPRYLLQGRNENSGMAIPSSQSILLGKTEPQLLRE